MILSAFIDTEGFQQSKTLGRPDTPDPRGTEIFGVPLVKMVGHIPPLLIDKNADFFDVASKQSLVIHSKAYLIGRNILRY